MGFCDLRPLLYVSSCWKFQSVVCDRFKTAIAAQMCSYGRPDLYRRRFRSHSKPCGRLPGHQIRPCICRFVPGRALPTITAPAISAPAPYQSSSSTIIVVLAPSVRAANTAMTSRAMQAPPATRPRRPTLQAASRKVLPPRTREHSSRPTCARGREAAGCGSSIEETASSDHARRSALEPPLVPEGGGM